VIFVTVGNATQGFLRLLDKVDQLAGERKFGSEIVLIQSGNNPNFRPLNCKHEPFLSSEMFETNIRDADLIITHAGAGTLIHTFQVGKVPVIFPRRKECGELVDDHQVELTQALAAEGRIIPAYEPEDLTAAIEEARRRKGSGVRGKEKKSPMLDLVAKAIDELMNA